VSGPVRNPEDGPRTSAGRDVLVVGGGPAGLVFALRAARRGLRVTVLDRARPPVDKACGEGLMPDGVARLTELGISSRELGGHPFYGIRYLDVGVPGDPGRDGGEALVAEGRFPGAPGRGVRRTALHRVLVRRAEEAGVDLRWGVRARGLELGAAGEPATVTTDHGAYSARWIVGADGLRSKVRRWAGLEKDGGRRRRFGVRRHFRVRPWTDRVEVYWSTGCEAYVTPVGPEEVGVAMLWGEGWSRGSQGDGPGFDRLLGDFPALARRLEGAPVVGRDRGMGPLHQRVRGVHRGPVALLGDAAGYLDAITGEGLSLAFHEAFALAETLAAAGPRSAADDPARMLRPYARTVRRLRRLPDFLTRLLLFVELRPTLRRRMIRTFSEDPQLFSRLLGIHARQQPPASLGLKGALRLGRGLARIRAEPMSM